MPSKCPQTQARRATAAVANYAGSLTVLPGLSTWSCTAGCPGPAAPLDAPALPAPPPAEALPPTAPAAAPPDANRPAAAFWLTRGPPLGLVADPTNSWLYVPLLHAAAADLAPSALESWRADPRATDWWEQARQLLATSAPVAPQTLIAALARTAETAPVHAHHLPDVVARIHDAGLPSGSLVHAGWAVRQLREPDGYLLTPVQEVLLECFGGHALAAALDRHSDRFRPAPAEAAPIKRPSACRALNSTANARRRRDGVP